MNVRLLGTPTCMGCGSVLALETPSHWFNPDGEFVAVCLWRGCEHEGKRLRFRTPIVPAEVLPTYPEGR
jgi:hypothetical protein